MGTQPPQPVPALGIFDAVDGFRAVANGIADGGFGDCFAGADECFIRQGHDAGTRGFRAAASAEYQVFRVGGERKLVEHVLQEHVIGLRLADENATEELGAIGGNVNAFVNARGGVLEADAANALALGEGIAEAGDIDTDELELGAHVEAFEGFLAAGEVGGKDFRHFVARGDEAVDHALEERAFANGENMRVRGDKR